VFSSSVLTPRLTAYQNSTKFQNGALNANRFRHSESS